MSKFTRIATAFMLMVLAIVCGILATSFIGGFVLTIQEGTVFTFVQWSGLVFIGLCLVVCVAVPLIFSINFLTGKYGKES
jgi:hypothetical protein